MRRGAREPLMPGHLFAFNADEIISLRRQLLPNRMARHDTPGEARLRQHVNNIKKRRGERTMD
jgi:hypothetical protein